MKALFVTLTYVALMIWLFAKFPLAMLALTAVAAISIGLLAYKASFDYELWSDLYKK